MTTQTIYVGAGFMLSIEDLGSMSFTTLITFKDDGDFRVQRKSTGRYLKDSEVKEYSLHFLDSVESMVVRKDIPVQYIIV
jgi:hypothetical protein